MSARKVTLALLCLAAVLAPASAAQAVAKPAWLLSSTALPSNFAPGAESGSAGSPLYLVEATNVGGAPSGAVTLTDTLPTGVTAVGTPEGCAPPAGQILTCAFTDPVAPGESLYVKVALDISPTPPPLLVNEVSLEEEGVPAAEVTTETPAGATPASFGILDGFQLPWSEEDGSAATLAGSHPYQLTAFMGFPTEKPGNVLNGAGHLREALLEFPPGEVINPAATPELCTEVELTSEVGPSCPDSSQVGTIGIPTVVGGPLVYTSPLYNMVPPPGTAAELAFDAVGAGIFVHLQGSVRSDSDYGISGGAADAPSPINTPVWGARVQLWGDPSGKSHDEMRGDCLIFDEEGGCPVAAKDKALLALPTACSGETRQTRARALSWEGEEAEASYESADLKGDPVVLSGCNGLEFEPGFQARPTTNLTGSPSGLNVTLHQPQDMSLGGRSPTPARDISVTLPEGLAVNAAAANGQDACSPAEAGLLTPAGESEAHFSTAPPSCPDASKIGTLEAETPLLVQFDPESGEVLTDPETGEPLPRVVPGSVYLAEPFQNPFGSLLAVYLSVEDPVSGVYARLAARVSADPLTGRLSTQLSGSPQLPLEEARVNLFEGDRASLRTPLACGEYKTDATLVPWASPEVADKAISDSFALTGAPGGAPCPTSPAAAPNRPGFVAGTLAPLAGAYSPLVMKLTREDGSQPIAGFEATLPRGLLARLAGVPYCSEAGIAQARSREQPNQGALEQSSPSCPAASQLGTLNAGAGAGPTPYYASGKIYLAGPYKGAPLSAVTITPAVAGPFDLGAVVIRAPIYIDPVAGTGRTVSDPIPQLLQGIPLDLRSVALRLDRPQFTLNPTSCDPMAVTGTATSAFGQPAALTSPFQVGGCGSLRYGPKLSTRLFGPTTRGGHPRFRAILTAKPGEANTKRISLTFPSSEFIDQAHFRTICTRVQFAAEQCPAGAIYGHAKVITPLLDYPLEGPVYLRSSSHKLPDVVLALHGPPSQPVEVEVGIRVDSVNGGLRTRVEQAPDAPFTKAIVTMQGASKGLFQNSTNICKGTHRSNLRLVAQSGKSAQVRPPMKADCGNGKHRSK